MMNDKKVSPSNPHLLYSEYMSTNATKHAICLIENKDKVKPSMKFAKSSVLSKVMSLLPRLKESQEELKKKSETEINIEILNENDPVVEMDVAVLKDLKDNEIPDLSEYQSDSDKSEDNEDLSISNIDDSDETESDSEESESDSEKGEGEQYSDELTRPANKDHFEGLPIKRFNRKLISLTKRVNFVPSDLLETESTDSVLSNPPSKRLCQMLD